jgi:hypothetical protein
VIAEMMGFGHRVYPSYAGKACIKVIGQEIDRIILGKNR